MLLHSLHAQVAAQSGRRRAVARRRVIVSGAVRSRCACRAGCDFCGGDAPVCSGSVAVWQGSTAAVMLHDGAAPSRSSSVRVAVVGESAVVRPAGATDPEHLARPSIIILLRA